MQKCEYNKKKTMFTHIQLSSKVMDAVGATVMLLLLAWQTNFDSN